MNALWRILGLEFLARLAARLPGRWAAWATGALLVMVNLLPLVGVLRGDLGMGDVFLVYWFENVVVWLLTIVRISTARGVMGQAPSRVRLTMNGRDVPMTNPGGLAVFFAVHYGVFTLVHGVFTGVMVVMLGLEANVWSLLFLMALMLASHLVSLAVYWFGRGERYVVAPMTVMWAPYPRMIALHVAVIGGFFLLLSREGGGLHGFSAEALGVALLCGLKTLLDLGFHLSRHWRVERALDEQGQTADGGLYREPS